MLYLRIIYLVIKGELKMKLVLETEQDKFYFHRFHGGDLIIIQNYTGNERVYQYAEAVRLGIVQFIKGQRYMVGTSWYYYQPSITEYRKF